MFVSRRYVNAVPFFIHGHLRQLFGIFCFIFVCVLSSLNLNTAESLLHIDVIFPLADAKILILWTPAISACCNRIPAKRFTYCWIVALYGKACNDNCLDKKAIRCSFVGFSTYSQSTPVLYNTGPIIRNFVQRRPPLSIQKADVKTRLQISNLHTQLVFLTSIENLKIELPQGCFLTIKRK